jgi:hypothetical protein
MVASNANDNRWEQQSKKAGTFADLRTRIEERRGRTQTSRQSQTRKRCKSN